MAIAYAIRRRRLRRNAVQRTFRCRFMSESMCEREFRERYRFSLINIQFILNLIRPSLITMTRRSKAVSPLLQLLVALRYFATGSFFRLIGDSVGLSEATVSRCVHRVATALCGIGRRYISFPTDRQLLKTKQEFYNLSRFPNVVGCVDCTHIRIQGPTANEKDFVNRKGFHSLNVQMTCDAKFHITSCVAKWPGSVHDSRIFRDSQLCSSFENGTYDGLLLGDSGYPCRHFLMTPYGNPVSNEQRQFNNSLCRARTTVEQTFGILKRRFACLSLCLRVSPTKAALITVACAVLHNLALELNENLDCVNDQNTCNGNADVANHVHYVGPDGDGVRVEKSHL
ncbi:putative nuclease HARBI1 [Argopecten irradians]|uniref:putative nuclease HARBI1 n=1 Tax=Argopecten irradians TaxID=31199 RepID=UPI0037112D1D